MREREACPWARIAFLAVTLEWGLLACHSNPSGGGSVIPDGGSPDRAFNVQGINISPPIDYDPGQPFADAVRAARDFVLPSNWGVNVPVDSNGWPTTDATLMLWDASYMSGTYRIFVGGQAMLAGHGALSVNASSVQYDAATDTTTADAVVAIDAQATAQLDFTSTRRTPQSALGTGIRYVNVMRPITRGAATAHDPAELFHRELIALVQKFNMVRFMEFVAVNTNQQVYWSDRATPAWASFSRNPGSGYGFEGVGAPWEYVVAFANQANVDAWINIPVKTNDDYVTKVAQVFKYGSDGVNPYTSAQTNPVFPPLKPNLHLYVEYGNEVWNDSPGFFDAYSYNQNRALAESGTGSPINFDGNGPANAPWRRVARRIVEISNLFRAVYEPLNSDAPMAVVRPVLATQMGDSQGTLSQGMEMLLNYFGGLGAPSFVPGTPTPPGGFHPPSYYIYGAGGGPYFSPALGVSLDQIWTSNTFSIDHPGWTGSLTADATRVAMIGVKLVAYEGGPEFLATTGSDAAVQQAAWSDSRMSQNLVAHYQSWASYGGLVLNWLIAVGDKTYGFAGPSLSDESTPKLAGVAQIASASKYPVTFGYALSAPRTAGEATLSSRGNGPGTAGSRTIAVNDPNQDMWLGFAYNASDSASRMVTLTFPSGSGTAKLYVDGAQVGTQAVGPGTYAFDAGTLTPGVHSVIVAAAAGSFELSTILLQ